ncbi:MAG: hypothetical protein QE495_15605 [Acidovorax sp.]|uniref:hypothetical protein n=1 Tax=Acidovorax sp. TaxID=1872122 RepID=UPI0025C33195|nr:hypothetical protein [Acidovorax sp.]MDH4427881.1 hypothetical protein [Acidovorax sp.]MDH4447751.1 hypothetical protein [Acidovorax sp.]MDH4466116.1 hypothetical protein [Acidovorax sp.]
MNGARTLKLASLALATALLGAGAWLAQSGIRQLALERQQFAQLQQSLDGARRMMPEVEQRERLVRSIKDVSVQVDRLGFDPARWGERRLRRPLGPVSRVEASQFLGELGRGGAGSVFVADVFDIATVSTDTGLFHSPQPGDKGLTLSVSGTLYFQTTASAPSARSVP